MGESMKKFTFIWMCLLSFLLGNGGCGPNMHEWNLESQRGLRGILSECVARGMTKSELIIQVGQPTAKEVVEGGEIWIYDLVDRGDTTTTGQVGPYGTFSATSSTPVDKTTVKVCFDKRGLMISSAIDGPARNQFRFLRSPQR